MMRYQGEIVDPHQHFWEPADGNQPWLCPEGAIDFRYGDYSAIKRRYLPDDYARDAEHWNVVATIYIETEWREDDPLGELAWVESLATRCGRPNAMIAHARLNRPDADAVLARHSASKLVRGIRHKPGGARVPGKTGRTLMSDEGWRRGYSLLERHGFHFELQVAWWHLDEAAALARDFPNTRIILNHTGLPSDRSDEALAGWRRALERLSREPNTAIKISGLGQLGITSPASTDAWIIEQAISTFTPDRAMFASNYPVDSLCGSFDDIYRSFSRAASSLGEEQQRKLFANTARHIYSLP